jgi:hypothetical protein
MLLEHNGQTNVQPNEMEKLMGIIIVFKMEKMDLIMFNLMEELATGLQSQQSQWTK